MKRTVFFLLFILLLSGCGGSDNGTPAEKPDSSTDHQQQSDTKYITPEYADAYFHDDAASGENNVLFDTSCISEGYIGVSAVSEKRLKLQVIKDDTYIYDIASDGTPSIIPLQGGNGEYTLRVMENVVDSSYALLYEENCEVELIDEFQPYIRTNDYVPYTKSSKCVKMAQDFAAESSDAIDLISRVFDYVVDNITYDAAKAETVQSGYMPDPDETLSTGSGICFDYASLTAAMFRSQGIPTKVIFGYVSPNNLYHAWNMIYTTEQGWIVAEFKMDQNNWNRIDLTFSANGADSQFIGDGSNYTGIYQY